MCSQLVQFMFARKRYDNHYCHNKPQTGNAGWSVDDVMPRRDGLRIWKILKKIQLSSVAAAVKFFGSRPAKMK